MSVDIAGIVSSAGQARSLIGLAKSVSSDPVSALSSAIRSAVPTWASALLSGRVDTLRTALGAPLVAMRADAPRPADAMAAAAVAPASTVSATGDPPPRGAVLLSLGPVQFLSGALAHQSISRSMDYRWPAQERLSRAPARQFMGRGEEAIELGGYTLTHYTGGAETVTRLRQLADQGEPQPLIDATGTVLGLYVLTRVETTGSELDASGRPLMLEFRLSLAAYGEDA